LAFGSKWKKKSNSLIALAIRVGLYHDYYMFFFIHIYWMIHTHTQAFNIVIIKRRLYLNLTWIKRIIHFSKRHLTRTFHLIFIIAFLWNKYFFNQHHHHHLPLPLGVLAYLLKNILWSAFFCLMFQLVYTRSNSFVRYLKRISQLIVLSAS
jgi:hypothetical protein